MVRIGALLFAIVATLLIRCGGGPETATVSGEVTLDGKKLEKGTIQFTPESGTGGSVDIVDGHYEIRTAPGRNHVQISAQVVTGKQRESNDPGAAEVDIYEEIIPERYNAASELKLDVQSGSNTKDWQLESGKKRR